MATSSGQAADPMLELLALGARELQGCFGRISKAIADYADTRELPASQAVPAPTAKPAKGKPAKKSTDNPDEEKPKRKPTAYNFYMKRKMRDLKAQGVETEKGGP